MDDDSTNNEHSQIGEVEFANDTIWWRLPNAHSILSHALVAKSPWVVLPRPPPVAAHATDFSDAEENTQEEDEEALQFWLYPRGDTTGHARSEETEEKKRIQEISQRMGLPIPVVPDAGADCLQDHASLYVTIQGGHYMEFHGQLHVGKAHREKVRFKSCGREHHVAGFHIFCRTDSLLEQSANSDLVIMLAQLEFHLPHLSRLQQNLHKPIADGYNVFTIPTAEQLSSIPRCKFCLTELEQTITECYAGADDECYDEEVSVPIQCPACGVPCCHQCMSRCNSWQRNGKDQCIMTRLGIRDDGRRGLCPECTEKSLNRCIDQSCRQSPFCDACAKASCNHCKAAACDCYARVGAARVRPADAHVFCSNCKLECHGCSRKKCRAYCVDARARKRHQRSMGRPASDPTDVNICICHRSVRKCRVCSEPCSFCRQLVCPDCISSCVHCDRRVCCHRSLCVDCGMWTCRSCQPHRCEELPHTESMERLQATSHLLEFNLGKNSRRCTRTRVIDTAGFIVFLTREDFGLADEKLEEVSVLDLKRLEMTRFPSRRPIQFRKRGPGFDLFSGFRRQILVFTQNQLHAMSVQTCEWTSHCLTFHPDSQWQGSRFTTCIVSSIASSTYLIGCAENCTIKVFPVDLVAPHIGKPLDNHITCSLPQLHTSNDSMIRVIGAPEGTWASGEQAAFFLCGRHLYIVSINDRKLALLTLKRKSLPLVAEARICELVGKQAVIRQGPSIPPRVGDFVYRQVDTVERDMQYRRPGSPWDHGVVTTIGPDSMARLEFEVRGADGLFHGDRAHTQVHTDMVWGSSPNSFRDDRPMRVVGLTVCASAVVAMVKMPGAHETDMFVWQFGKGASSWHHLPLTACTIQGGTVVASHGSSVYVPGGLKKRDDGDSGQEWSNCVLKLRMKKHRAIVRECGVMFKD